MSALPSLRVTPTLVRQRVGGEQAPDFLFPSAAAYHEDPSADRLTMLAAKTTCKDRWRQILNEVDSIPLKHLFTLQEGISLDQFEELKRAGVGLVVPSRLHRAFHPRIAPKLLRVREFIERTIARIRAM